MVTLLLRPRLIHYYGFICHLTPLRLTLKLPLESLLPFSGMMPGFPSYCAGSLLLIPSSSTFCLCPHIGLRDISHTHPDNLPNQVRFRYGPSTSYHFLQTPPLASDALVSRILFPVDGARSLLSERRGLPASLGKQKKAAKLAALNVLRRSYEITLILLHLHKPGNEGTA